MDLVRFPVVYHWSLHAPRKSFDILALYKSDYYLYYYYLLCGRCGISSDRAKLTRLKIMGRCSKNHKTTDYRG